MNVTFSRFCGCRDVAARAPRVAKLAGSLAVLLTSALLSACATPVDSENDLDSNPERSGGSAGATPSGGDGRTITGNDEEGTPAVGEDGAEGSDSGLPSAGGGLASGGDSGNGGTEPSDGVGGNGGTEPSDGSGGSSSAAASNSSGGGGGAPAPVAGAGGVGGSASAGTGAASGSDTEDVSDTSESSSGGSGGSDPASGGSDSAAEARPALPACWDSCEIPADCVFVNATAISDENNYACDSGVCRYLGCIEDDECESHASGTVCRDGGCLVGCSTVADCSTEFAAHDEDNFVCDGGACHYTGCNSDLECQQTFSSSSWCRETDAEVPSCTTISPDYVDDCRTKEDCYPQLNASVIYDGDNYECVDGLCVYLGCSSDAECEEWNPGSGMICRAL